MASSAAAWRAGRGTPASCWARLPPSTNSIVKYGRPVLVADVVDLHDVGVAQAGDRLGLPEEPLPLLRAGVGAGQEHLEGDGAVESQVSRPGRRPPCRRGRAPPPPRSRGSAADAQRAALRRGVGPPDEWTPARETRRRRWASTRREPLPARDGPREAARGNRGRPLPGSAPSRGSPRAVAARADRRPSLVSPHVVDVRPLPAVSSYVRAKVVQLLRQEQQARFKRRCTVLAETPRTSAASAWVSPWIRTRLKTSRSSSGRLSMACKHAAAVRAETRRRCWAAPAPDLRAAPRRRAVHLSGGPGH